MLNPTKSWVKLLRHWAVELLVVFAGVYSAFLLSEFRAEKQAEERRIQIVHAIKAEIEDVLGRTTRAAGNLARLVVYYDSTIASGEMPQLYPMIEPIRAESHMWEATLQTGGLEYLDVPTMYRISKFYNALNAGFEQLGQLRVLSERYLIPNLDKGNAEFYDLKSKQLLKKYQWYIEGLRRISLLAEEIKVAGNEVLEDLEAKGYSQ